MPLPPSAADWTRYQRLKQSVTYGTPGAEKAIDLSGNTDLLAANRLQDPYNPETLNSRDGGGLRTRREASKWVDYTAATHTDFVTNVQNPQVREGRQMTRTQLCPTCVTATVYPRVGILRSAVYQHLRIV